MSDLYFGLDTNARLVGADPEKDQLVGTDELGRKIYEMRGSKKRYYVGDVEAPTSLPQTAKAAYEAIPPVEDWRLPTGEEFWGGIKGAAKAVGEGVWDAVSSPTNPEASLGNTMDAASLGFTGAFTRVGQAFDPSVLSAGGAAPRYLKKPSTGSTVSDEMLTRTPSREVGNRTLRRYETGEYVDDDLVDLDFVAEEVDENGVPILRMDWGVDPEVVDPIYYGRDITVHDIAELDLGRTTPEELANYYGMDATPELLDYIQNVGDTIRQTPEYQNYLGTYRQMNESWHPMDGAEFEHLPKVPQQTDFRSPLREVLDGWEFPKNGITGAQFLKGLQDNPTIRNSEIKSWGLELDPQRRYTKDELLNIIEPRQYNVFTEKQNVFGQYQRQQDLADPEVDYTELIIRGYRGDGFEANSQHFAPDTLAHTRVSERQGPNGNYLLIEEIQSDLLQKGYREPTTPITSDQFLQSAQKGLDELVSVGSRRVSRESLEQFSKAFQESIIPALDDKFFDDTTAKTLLHRFIRDGYLEGLKWSVSDYLPLNPSFRNPNLKLNTEFVLGNTEKLDISDWLSYFSNTPKSQQIKDIFGISDEDISLLNPRDRSLINNWIDDFVDNLGRQYELDVFSYGRADAKELEKQALSSYKSYSQRVKPKAAFLHSTLDVMDDLLPSDTYSSPLRNQIREAIESVKGENLGLPPIAKTEEGVRLSIEAAIAEADARGLNEVVIPPFEKIIEKRFWDEKQLAKARDPKSGFYATYVKGLDKVLKGLKSEFGDNVKITEEPLNYNNPIMKMTDWGRWVDQEFAPRLEQRIGHYRAPRGTINVMEEEFAQWIENHALHGSNTPPSERSLQVYNVFTEDLGIDLSPYFQTIHNSIEEFGDTTHRPSLSSYLREVLNKNTVKSNNLNGVRIDFSGLRDEGYDLQKPKFAEGGVVENPNIDPVSGNPVPPGATPKEVRDDVTINASEGEYVIPANVVRFIGLDRIEKMVENAKKKLMEMDQNGRIGGQKDGDLPFSSEELVAVEDSPQAAQQSPRPAAQNMAEGGVVSSGYQLPTVPEGINPLTGLPYWMEEQAAQTGTQNTVASVNSENANSVTDRDTKESKGPVRGMAASVDAWTPEDFVKYGTARNSMEQRMAQGAVGALVPFGGLLTGMRQRYLERNVPTAISRMLETGFDQQGNPLTEDQIAQLEQTAATINSTPLNKGVGRLFTRRQTPTTTPTETGRGFKAPETNNTQRSSSPVTRERENRDVAESRQRDQMREAADRASERSKSVRDKAERGLATSRELESIDRNARDIENRLNDRARGVTSRGFAKGGLVKKRK